MSELQDRIKSFDDEIQNDKLLFKIVEYLLIVLPIDKRMSIDKVKNKEKFEEALDHISKTNRDRLIGRCIHCDGTHFWKVKCLKMDLDAVSIVITIKAK